MDSFAPLGLPPGAMAVKKSPCVLLLAGIGPVFSQPTLLHAALQTRRRETPTFSGANLQNAMGRMGVMDRV
jgi:hypothetical protein